LQIGLKKTPLGEPTNERGFKEPRSRQEERDKNANEQPRLVAETGGEDGDSFSLGLGRSRCEETYALKKKKKNEGGGAEERGERTKEKPNQTLELNPETSQRDRSLMGVGGVERGFILPQGENVRREKGGSKTG